MRQIPIGFTGQMGKPKLQNPNSKQIPRSQIPKPRGLAPASELGVWSLFGIWDLDFGIFAHEMKLLMRQPHTRRPVPLTPPRPNL
jgi:hypothetical protein